MQKAGFLTARLIFYCFYTRVNVIGNVKIYENLKIHNKIVEHGQDNSETY